MMGAKLERSDILNLVDQGRMTVAELCELRVAGRLVVCHVPHGLLDDASNTMRQMGKMFIISGCWDFL